MALLFDFQCSEGHTTESLRSSDTKFIVCPSCGKTAKKIVSPIRIHIDPINGSSWKASRKWAKQREQRIQQERKENS